MNAIRKIWVGRAMCVVTIFFVEMIENSSAEPLNGYDDLRKIKDLIEFLDRKTDNVITKEEVEEMFSRIDREGDEAVCALGLRAENGELSWMTFHH